MTEGLVSVIMPSWNTGEYLAEAIQSVIDQTYTKWELIIVDDCSTDQTDEIIALFHDDRIRYFKNDRNSGAALARNRALQKACGEWIAFLDSDDLWNPEKLEKQIDFMLQNGYVFSYTEYEKIDEGGNALGIVVTGPVVIRKKEIYRYDYIGHLTMMYNVKEFGMVQIKNISKNNDYAIRLQLYKRDGACCYLLNENLAKYRIRKKSISHDSLLKKIKSHYELFRICDSQSVWLAGIFTIRNMFYGVLKKIRYER
ncbi:glycosyltransferase [Kineothrix sp. MSJ-39]|nr:glycosyltransferase family 2 protein [Kineothrix sp. MSJ-39]MBU5430215.1 glycosyltransferase [Kineothrix sp. MSJ-39]